MRDAQAGCDIAGVVDVLPGAAGAFAGACLAMVVQLKRDADHLMPGFTQEGGGDAAVHPAGHRGHDSHGDPGSLGSIGKV